jgi:hypothetical protein
LARTNKTAPAIRKAPSRPLTAERWGCGAKADGSDSIPETERCSNKKKTPTRRTPGPKGGWGRITGRFSSDRREITYKRRRMFLSRRQRATMSRIRRSEHSTPQGRNPLGYVQKAKVQQLSVIGRHFKLLLVVPSAGQVLRCTDSLSWRFSPRLLGKAAIVTLPANLEPLFRGLTWSLEWHAHANVFVCTSVRTCGSTRSGPLADLDYGGLADMVRAPRLRSVLHQEAHEPQRNWNNVQAN